LAEASAVADRDRDEEERRKKENVADTATDAGEGAFEAVGEGCFGCDLVIALTLVAGLPLLLWAV
jgi:hypothetical protein